MEVSGCIIRGAEQKVFPHKLFSNEGIIDWKLLFSDKENLFRPTSVSRRKIIYNSYDPDQIIVVPLRVAVMMSAYLS